MLVLILTGGVLAEQGHLPPPPEENYNSMILDYVVSGAVFEKKTYNDDWTRTYTYEGKLDPSFGGVLRVTGDAQWLTYPGPESPYQWYVLVRVSAGSETREKKYEPKTKSQHFDLSVPIGKAQQGSFLIEMVRSSTGGSRNMRAMGTMNGQVVLGPGNPDTTSEAGASTQVKGPTLTEQMAREAMGREMANPAQIKRDQVLYTGNDRGVSNRGKPPHFTLDAATRIYFVMSYHYNDGYGAEPGYIGFRRSDGKVYGPWTATAVNKVYWIVNPKVVLPAGTYEVVDSDPMTWSQNEGYGHVLIKGRPR